MKITKGVKIDKVREYKVGDLFEIELFGWTGTTRTFIYELIEVYDEYMLIRFDDDSKKYHTYNGKHSSIEELFDNFDEDTNIVAHYPNDEYELTLTKK